MAFGNNKFRAALLAELNNRSEVADTACGSFEYSRQGTAPYIVQFHGTPGGHDSGVYTGAPFIAAGFGDISLSRPGYLRTPLDTGRTSEEQADAAAALLDALGIDQVAAHGISGGGPSAIQFAARHPGRTLALFLSCALSQPFSPDIPLWSKPFLSPWGARLATWMFDRYPKMSIKQVVQEESTLTGAECEREADRIMNSPELMKVARSLAFNGVPWEDRREGFYNDLEQYRAIERIPLPLEEIRCPTMIAHGTADDDVPFSHAEQAHRRIPNSTLYEMEGAWHVLWLCEGAEDMVHTQVDFLKTLLGRE